MIIKRIEPLSLGKVAGALYNLAAGFAGGIEIDVQ
jgi:hypothetical protein